jgi:hypothetical protein
MDALTHASGGLTDAEIEAGGRQTVDKGPSARRAASGMAPGPRELTDEEAGVSTGPEMREGGNYVERNGRIREKTPYEQSSIDPTAQFLIQNMALHGAGKLVGGLLGRAVANTRGATAAETVAEANGAFDPAAEKAAEALRFKLLPAGAHSPVTAGLAFAGQHYMHNPGYGLLADFIARNAVPIEGALSRGAATKLVPPALMGATAGTGAE